MHGHLFPEGILYVGLNSWSFNVVCKLNSVFLLVNLQNIRVLANSQIYWYTPSITVQLNAVCSFECSLWNWPASLAVLVTDFSVISHDTGPVPGTTALTVSIPFLPSCKSDSTFVYEAHQLLKVYWFFNGIFFLSRPSLLITPLHSILK